MLNFAKGNVSLEKLMEEDEVEKDIFKGTEDLDTSIFDVLDYDTERLLDGFFKQLSDVEKFFILLEVHSCDMEYTKMTVAQLGTNELLLKIVESDQRLKKNLSVGDIRIERPGRSSSIGNFAIELKGVKLVNNNLIRYQMTKAIKTLAQLKEVIHITDITGGCGVEYLKKQWNTLCGNFGINEL